MKIFPTTICFKVDAGQKEPGIFLMKNSIFLKKCSFYVEFINAQIRT